MGGDSLCGEATREEYQDGKGIINLFKGPLERRIETVMGHIRSLR